MGKPDVRKDQGEKYTLYPIEKRTLTDAAKEEIRRRDGYECQFPGVHVCNGKDKTLHVHHVSPFGVEVQVKGLSAKAADHPYNVISVCEDIHIGGNLNPVDEIIHPDTARARRAYRTDPEAFIKMKAERERLMKRGEPYHNDAWDHEMAAIAVANTIQAVRRGTFDWKPFDGPTEGPKKGPRRRAS